MQTVLSTHIAIDERGVAWIDGTKVKVREIALDKTAYGWSAEEIHEQYPQLSLSRIHAALAYYYDHQAAIDAEIAAGLAAADRLRQENLDSPGRRKLRAAGKIA
jgi:uncharacterized protein (DUF433 family)